MLRAIRLSRIGGCICVGGRSVQCKSPGWDDGTKWEYGMGFVMTYCTKHLYCNYPGVQINQTRVMISPTVTCTRYFQLSHVSFPMYLGPGPVRIRTRVRNKLSHLLDIIMLCCPHTSVYVCVFREKYRSSRSM